MEIVGSIIRADPGQLDQVLLYLATNARDAIPSRGMLTIETMNIGSPSLAVRLIVRGTGQVMSPEVRAKIFEPFPHQRIRQIDRA